MVVWMAKVFSVCLSVFAKKIDSSLYPCCGTSRKVTECIEKVGYRSITN